MCFVGYLEEEGRQADQCVEDCVLFVSDGLVSETPRNNSVAAGAISLGQFIFGTRVHGDKEIATNMLLKCRLGGRLLVSTLV